LVFFWDYLDYSWFCWPLGETYTHGDLETGTAPYSAECVEGGFSEVGLPLYALRSCARFCNPSYLVTLRNTAGLTSPAIKGGGGQCPQELESTP